MDNETCRKSSWAVFTHGFNSNSSSEPKKVCLCKLKHFCLYKVGKWVHSFPEAMNCGWVDAEIGEKISDTNINCVRERTSTHQSESLNLVCCDLEYFVCLNSDCSI